MNHQRCPEFYDDKDNNTKELLRLSSNKLTYKVDQSRTIYSKFNQIYRKKSDKTYDIEFISLDTP